MSYTDTDEFYDWKKVYNGFLNSIFGKNSKENGDEKNE